MNKLSALKPIEIETLNSRILAFQQKYNFTFNEDYKKVLEYNVCKPQKTYFKAGDIEFNLNYFFGFSEIEYEDLFYNYETYFQRVPEELFPIGSVDGGDLLLMNKKTGEIYYWFHEEDDWGLEGVTKWPKKIANNIYEYIAVLILKDCPSAEEIENAKKHGKIKSISPIGLQLLNNDREKRGLSPLTMEEAMNQ